jgi:hypothetical protein
MTSVMKVHFLANNRPPLDRNWPQSTTSRPLLKLMDTESSVVYGTKKGKMRERDNNENIDWRRWER